MIGRITIASSPLERAHHRALHDLAHAQDADLRLVDDREAVQVSEAARVRDREAAALELVGGELLRARAVGEILDGLREPGQREPIGVARDRHHQAFFGLDRDPDVDVLLLHDRVLEHRGVEARELAQRAHAWRAPRRAGRRARSRGPARRLRLCASRTRATRPTCRSRPPCRRAGSRASRAPCARRPAGAAGTSGPPVARLEAVAQVGGAAGRGRRRAGSAAAGCFARSHAARRPAW